MRTTNWFAAMSAVALLSSGLWAGPEEAQEAKLDTLEAPAVVGPEDLKSNLLGAWVLQREPGKNRRIKFWGQNHWLISEADKGTGEVIFHHGGTYTLDGDRYVETVTFANENTTGMIGDELRFRIEVEGDTYRQFGENNQFTETWTRLTEANAQFERVAQYRFQPGSATGAGTPFTVVAMEQGPKGGPRVIVSSAGQELTGREFRVLAQDARGENHAASETEISVGRVDANVSVVTLVVDFDLPADEMESIVIERSSTALPAEAGTTE